MQTTELTVVLRAREGEHIADLAPFLRTGSTVAIGRSGALVSAVSTGDKITHAERLENQVVLAESAMRRGVQLPENDHIPAIRRVIDHVPNLYLAVADQVKQDALDDGDDNDMAEEAAGQAIRVLVMFKQRLEKLLEPDLLTPPGIPTTEKSLVVAETPYAQVRVTNIDEWIKTVSNARRYEWLRDEAWDTPFNRLVPRDLSGALTVEQDLDDEIDYAMRATPALDQRGEPA